MGLSAMSHNSKKKIKLAEQHAFDNLEGLPLTGDSCVLDSCIFTQLFLYRFIYMQQKILLIAKCTIGTLSVLVVFLCAN